MASESVCVLEGREREGEREREREREARASGHLAYILLLQRSVRPPTVAVMQCVYVQASLSSHHPRHPSLYLKSRSLEPEQGGREAALNQF